MKVSIFISQKMPHFPWDHDAYLLQIRLEVVVIFLIC